MFNKFFASLTFISFILMQVLMITNDNTDMKSIIKPVIETIIIIFTLSSIQLGASLKGTSVLKSLIDINYKSAFGVLLGFSKIFIFYPFWGFINSILWVLSTLIPFIPSPNIEKVNFSSSNSKKPKKNQKSDSFEEENDSENTNNSAETTNNIKPNQSRIRKTKSNEKRNLKPDIMDEFPLFKVSNDSFAGPSQCHDYNEAMNLSKTKYKNQIVKVYLSKKNGIESRELGYYYNGDYI